MNSLDKRCYVCYKGISYNDHYAMLDTQHEYYHIHCIEKWLTENKINESYTIYQFNRIIAHKSPHFNLYNTVIVKDYDNDCCYIL